PRKRSLARLQSPRCLSAGFSPPIGGGAKATYRFSEKGAKRIKTRSCCPKKRGSLGKRRSATGPGHNNPFTLSRCGTSRERNDRGGFASAAIGEGPGTAIRQRRSGRNLHERDAQRVSLYFWQLL